MVVLSYHLKTKKFLVPVTYVKIKITKTQSKPLFISPSINKYSDSLQFLTPQKTKIEMEK